MTSQNFLKVNLALAEKYNRTLYCFDFSDFKEDYCIYYQIEFDEKNNVFYVKPYDKLNTYLNPNIENNDFLFKSLTNYSIIAKVLNDNQENNLSLDSNFYTFIIPEYYKNSTKHINLNDLTLDSKKIIKITNTNTNINNYNDFKKNFITDFKNFYNQKFSNPNCIFTEKEILQLFN